MLFKMFFFMIAVVSCAMSDEIVIIQKYQNDRSISKASLAIVPVLIGDSLKIGQFKRMGIEERRARTKELFWKYFPGQAKFFASFKSVAICTTGAVSYLASDLKIAGKTIQYRIPEKVDPKDVPYDFLLVLQIPLVYDDSSKWGPNFWPKNIFSFSPVQPKPEEECINYFCTYLFYDCKMKTTACYGWVTAEGCGFRMYRLGDQGCWAESLTDLAQQVLEDTPFAMKESSDF